MNSFEIDRNPSKIHFLENTKIVSAQSMDGNQIKVTACFFTNTTFGLQLGLSASSVISDIMSADNAVVVIQVPTTSPKPVVIVPKDAVLPVTGGHLFILEERKRTIVQIGGC